ncbi:MAG: hypothetical protein LBQ50_04570 [Planctomycetaceae bacterium]|jgi:polyhydroxyalkanoate synthesis regulator phasin|nr:hypothetical protein [Planctomycetaceae bacterium]
MTDFDFIEANSEVIDDIIENDIPNSMFDYQRELLEYGKIRQQIQKLEQRVQKLENALKLAGYAS